MPTLSSVGASLFPPCLRFHTPLIEPDVRICRIRLSEKTHAMALAMACDAVCKTSENNSGVVRLIANLPFYRRFLRPPSTGRVRWWRGSGLRMMPTFPPPPLSFRTAGFPQYGWKVGLSVPFPRVAQLKPAPGMPWATQRFASTLRALRCPTLRSALCRNKWTRWRTAIRGVDSSTPEALAPVWVLLSQPIIA